MLCDYIKPKMSSDRQFSYYVKKRTPHRNIIYLMIMKFISMKEKWIWSHVMYIRTRTQHYWALEMVGIKKVEKIIKAILQ